MIHDLKKFLIIFLLVAGGLFLIHLFLLKVFPHFFAVQSEWIIEMYLFLGILTSIHYIGLLWLFKKWPIHSGLLFTGMSLIKMGIAIVYLFPYIFPSIQGSTSKALNFMASYLIILAFEVIYLTRNMLKKQLF
jgi:hypothetical protein